MAKILVTQRDHRPIRLQSHVRDVRARYERALRLGYSSEEAAKIANDGIDPRPKERTEPSVVTKKVQRLKPEQVVISGQAQHPLAIDDVPPNWQELPWPHLRDLASRAAGKMVRSRNDAEKAITKFLAGTAEDRQEQQHEEV